MCGNITSYLTTCAPGVIKACIIILVFWMLGVVVKCSIKKIFSSFKNKTVAVLFIANSSKNIIILLGLVMGLSNLGINVNALIASLSLFSFTAGFAVKDIISNTISGLMIILYEPFKINENISSVDFSGKVNKINLRYTVLLDGDKEIYVPNSLLLDRVVTVNKNHK